MERETEESPRSAVFEEILGDKAEPAEEQVVKITPVWQREAQKRSASRHEEPRVNRRSFLIPNRSEKATVAIKEIGKIVRSGDFSEIRIAFGDVDKIEEVEWPDS